MRICGEPCSPLPSRDKVHKSRHSQHARAIIFFSGNRRFYRVQLKADSRFFFFFFFKCPVSLPPYELGFSSIFSFLSALIPIYIEKFNQTLCNSVLRNACAKLNHTIQVCIWIYDPPQTFEEKRRDHCILNSRTNLVNAFSR